MLGIIGNRADALGRFMSGCAQLASLPSPELAAREGATGIRRIVSLETGNPVTMKACPPTVIQADPGHLEQALINLLRHSVDASPDTGGQVTLSRIFAPLYPDVRIQNEGHGLLNKANLFVPFLTTKPGGSGIGRALSRQIIDNNNGSLTLQNRERPDSPSAVSVGSRRQQTGIISRTDQPGCGLSVLCPLPLSVACQFGY